MSAACWCYPGEKRYEYPVSLKEPDTREPEGAGDAYSSRVQTRLRSPGRSEALSGTTKAAVARGGGRSLPGFWSHLSDHVSLQASYGQDQESHPLRSGFCVIP